MSCKDKKYEKMLYAYSLGLLFEEDRAGLELHLLSCDSCYSKVQQLTGATDLIKRDQDVKDSVMKLTAEEERRRQPGLIARQLFTTFKSRTYVPAALMVIVLLFLLLVKPWRLEFQSSLEAVAQENRLLVMYFENLADPADSLRVGRIITNLMITDLSESRYLQVISAQRLDDLLDNMGYGPGSPEIFAKSMDVARRADSRLLVTGKIVNDLPYEVVAQLINVPEGTIISSLQVKAEATGDVFAAVDDITGQILAAIGLPPEADKEIRRPVMEITTTSVDAYRHYLKGVDLVDRYYLDEAISEFNLALQYDSTMAMAFYYLAFLADKAYIDNAMRYKDDVNRRGRSYIEIAHLTLAGKHKDALPKILAHIDEYPDDKVAYSILADSYRALGQFRNSVNTYRKALEIDSLYISVYNRLSSVYDLMDDYEMAIWSLNKFIELSPVKASGYDALGQLMARHGKLDEAIQAFKTALEIKPDFQSAIGNLGYMYLFKNEYQKADSCFQIMATSRLENIKRASQYYRIWIPVRQGQFQTAIERLTLSIEDDYKRNEGILKGSLPAYKIQLLAHIYSTLGQDDIALSCMRGKVGEIGYSGRTPSSVFPAFYCYLLGKAGEGEEAGGVNESLRSYFEDLGRDLGYYWYSKGCTELGAHNPALALEYFDKLSLSKDQFDRHFMKALAYLENGNLGQAVSGFEDLQTIYNSPRGTWQIWDVLSHYYLGLAYERSNWYDKAVEQYELFDSIWKNADRELREIYDVQKRLGILRTKI